MVDGGSSAGSIETKRLHASLRSRLFGDDDAVVVSDRYAVEATLGAGAMGIVYRARDRELDRAVALKVVNPAGLRGQDATRVRTRLLAEARTMAQLADPNIVTVFDVGQLGDGLFIAMELCPGVDLQTWLGERSRPWQEIVEVFGAAARGLAAAHEAGVVHRDFKPGNVMVGGDGRVRVIDFGLARTPLPTTDPTPQSDDSLSGVGSSGRATRLSFSGAVAGTPAYMAPEQHLGAEPTPAADQYALCVALWEALCGARPFAARSYVELVHRKQQGPPPWPAAADPTIPRRIAKALSRGLAPDAGQRWPSVAELLAALQPRTRRRRAVFAMGATLTGTAAALIVTLPTAQPKCRGAEPQLAGAWDDAQREAVRSAMLESGGAVGERAWERTGAAFDRYAEDWVAMRTEACEATAVDAVQSGEVLDLRMACLERARSSLSAASDVLARQNAETVRRADAVVGGLLPLARCADVAALEEEVEPPPPHEAPIVAQILDGMERTKADLASADYERARTEIARAHELLRQVEYRPVRTRVSLMEGYLLEETGEYAAAETKLREALEEATRWGQSEWMTRAATMLISTAGRKRPEDGLRYRTLAMRLAEGDPFSMAEVENRVGGLLKQQGDYVGAEAAYRRALELGEGALGAAHPFVGTWRHNVGLALKDQGKLDAAEAEVRHGLRIREAAFGPEHPDVAASQYALAQLLADRGRTDEAVAEFRAVIGRLEASLGAEHPHVATARNSLGSALRSQGKLAEAEAEFRRALAVQVATQGAESDAVLMTRNNLAGCLSAQERFDEALAEFRAALEACLVLYGPEHPSATAIHINMGVLLGRRNDLPGALAEYERALQVYESAAVPDHPRKATALFNMADILAALGRYEEAEATARRSVATHRALLGDEHPDTVEAQEHLDHIVERRPP